MVFSDRALATRELARIGYYRLKGYIHPLRKDPASSVLSPGIPFEQALWYYQFDRDLRIAVLRGLERVEIGVRAMLTAHLTKAGGCFAHRDPNLLEVARSESGAVIFDPVDWLGKLDDAVMKDKHEAFIAHFRNTYSGFPRVPCWVALELTHFGDLSRIYKGCKNGMRDAMAKDFGIDEKVLGSWILTLSNVRNFCAHHGRLWNRSFRVQPLLVLGRGKGYWKDAPRDRLFLRLAILRRILKVFSDDNEWAEQIERGFGQDFSDPRIAARMGLPFSLDVRGSKVFFDWGKHPLWAPSSP